MSNVPWAKGWVPGSVGALSDPDGFQSYGSLAHVPVRGPRGRMVTLGSSGFVPLETGSCLSGLRCGSTGTKVPSLHPFLTRPGSS